MKHVLVLTLAAVSMACGSKGGSGSSTNPATPIQINPTTTQYTLIASIAEPSDVQTSGVGVQSAYSNANAVAPTTLMSIQNLTEATHATLTLGSCQFYYKQLTQNSQTSYQLYDGTCSLTAPVSMLIGSSIVLSIDHGYATQQTQANAVVTIVKQ